MSCSYWVYHFVDLEEVDTRLESLSDDGRAYTKSPIPSGAIGFDPTSLHSEANEQPSNWNQRIMSQKLDPAP